MFADYLERLGEAAKTGREIECCMSEIAALGFEKHILGIRPLSAQRVSSGVLESTNFESDWVDAYFGGLHVNDPVVQLATTSPFPFVWHDCPIETPAQRDFMGQAADSGLVDGISVPLVTTEGFQGAVSVCGDGPVDTRASLERVFSMTTAMHVVRVKRWSIAILKSHSLTERELEVMRWLAAGKSDWAISCILAISERTVRFHVQNLFKKLGLGSRVGICAVAHQAGVADARDFFVERKTH